MTQQNTSDSICRQRIRKRLVNLLRAALFLLMSLAIMAYAASRWMSERSYWEVRDWLTAILSVVLGLTVLAAGLYELVIFIREAFFPAQSRLDQDIPERNTPETKTAEEQNMVFTRPDGTDTSRVTEEMVTAALGDAIRLDDETLFTLTPTVPYEAGGRKLAFLQCAVLGVDDPDFDEDDLKDEAEIYLIAGIKPEPGQPPETAYVLDCVYDEAERILLDWFRGSAPDVSGWLPIDIRVWEPPKKQPDPQPPKLVLESASGVLQSHESFEREDVEAAAEGLRDGTYRLVELTLPGGYLTFRVEPGGGTDGRCTVTATSDEDGSLRFYTLECSKRQAAGWLLDYYDGGFRPAKPEWKDITKKAYQQRGV